MTQINYNGFNPELHTEVRKDVIKAAKGEIERLIGIMKLSQEHNEIILKKVMSLRGVFSKGFKFRETEKLVPLSIYLYLTLNHVKVDSKLLVKRSGISSREFNSFMVQMKRHLPTRCYAQA